MFLVLISLAVVLTKPSFGVAVALNLAAMLVSLPVAVAGIIWVTRRRLSAPAERETAVSTPVPMRAILGFSSTMLAIQLLTFKTTQADLWIAGLWCPHDQLALYGAARRLVLLVALPLQMMNLTVMASIAELFGQRRLGDLEHLLRSSALYAALPACVFIAGLIVWGGPLLELLFGPFFRQAATALSILGIGQLFLVGVGSCGGSWR